MVSGEKDGMRMNIQKSRRSLTHGTRPHLRKKTTSVAFTKKNKRFLSSHSSPSSLHSDWKYWIKYQKESCFYNKLSSQRNQVIMLCPSSFIRSSRALYIAKAFPFSTINDSVINMSPVKLWKLTESPRLVRGGGEDLFHGCSAPKPKKGSQWKNVSSFRFFYLLRFCQP